jgi:hypothetical protein
VAFSKGTSEPVAIAVPLSVETLSQGPFYPTGPAGTSWNLDPHPFNTPAAFNSWC